MKEICPCGHRYKKKGKHQTPDCVCPKCGRKREAWGGKVIIPRFRGNMDEMIKHIQRVLLTNDYSVTSVFKVTKYMKDNLQTSQEWCKEYVESKKKSKLKVTLEWDLLQRIADYYQFPTAVFCGNEKMFKKKTREQSLIKKAEMFDKILEVVKK